MARGFSMDSIIISQRIKKILEAENDWMLYEMIELKTSRYRYIADYSFPTVMNDALNYLLLCGAIIKKQDDDQVYYKLEK